MFCEKCGSQILSNDGKCETCGDIHSKGPADPTVTTEAFANDYVGKYRSGGIILLLSIVTCGIYFFYWLYVTMEDINKATGEQRLDSTLLLIGSIFCAPVILVALYKIKKNLEHLSKQHRTYYQDNFVLWLILSLLCGIGELVAIFQVSKGLNDIWEIRQSHKYRL